MSSSQSSSRYVFQPMSDDPFGPMKKRIVEPSADMFYADTKNTTSLFFKEYITFTDNRPGESWISTCYPVGATLAIALTEQGLIDDPRALPFANKHVPKTLFSCVIEHIRNTESVFEIMCVTLDKPEHQVRFIKEMAIEFNLVCVMDELVAEYEDGTMTMSAILEYLKQEYHGSWKNQKDFEWIASMCDFTQKYIDDQYALLDGVM